MRLSFELRGTGVEGVFEAWCDDGQQLVSLRTRRGSTQVCYPNPVTGDPWLFVARALQDLEVQRLQDRAETLETALAKAIHE